MKHEPFLFFQNIFLYKILNKKEVLGEIMDLFLTLTLHHSIIVFNAFAQKATLVSGYGTAFRFVLVLGFSTGLS